MPLRTPCLLLLLCLSMPVVAADLRVAVASNFAPVLHRIVERFTAQTGYHALIASASSGKHYAQIRNGAAFDLFLSADAERPRLLEAAGVGAAGSRFTYAEGRLVLWAPGVVVPDDPRAWLGGAGPDRLAIANPRLAPYGLAARQVLENWGLWERLRTRTVRGENVGQAYQFVATGNAPAGLLALSQILLNPRAAATEYREIDADLHAPILQQALLLRTHAASRAFVEFLRGAEARALIVAAGYRVPETP